jgi:hypothetical protein
MQGRKLIRLLAPQGKPGGELMHFGTLNLDVPEQLLEIDLGALGRFALIPSLSQGCYRDAVALPARAYQRPVPLDKRRMRIRDGQFFYQGEYVGLVRQVLVMYEAAPCAPMIFQPPQVQRQIIEAHRKADAVVTPAGKLEYRPKNKKV